MKQLSETNEIVEKIKMKVIGNPHNLTEEIKKLEVSFSKKKKIVQIDFDTLKIQYFIH